MNESLVRVAVVTAVGGFFSFLMPFTTKVLSAGQLRACARMDPRRLNSGGKPVKGDSDFEKSVPPQRTPIIIVSYKRSKTRFAKKQLHSIRCAGS